MAVFGQAKLTQQSIAQMMVGVPIPITLPRVDLEVSLTKKNEMVRRVRTMRLPLNYITLCQVLNGRVCKGDMLTPNLQLVKKP